ncbi:MarR family transcriptional regulator [Sphingomonas ginkgonis]|uniref:MarR family transcriptional regulator n=1 Tax=Sphingomonas ginkgonis TaxID=2315330 RepID=A0A3R9Y5P4_9SPHN|nr:MarR family transcriptional regulator [Sphingomonas ginkgonis]RST30627.1 MarR family transcriptional regulator [Sphingomonas ginkgonis]
MAVKTSSADRDRLIDFARAVIAHRSVRQRHFPLNMLGETAWEALLAIYVHDPVGPMDLPELAASLSSSSASLTRWLDYLEAEGLIELLPSGRGETRQLRLSASGLERTEACLGEMLRSWSV